MDQLRIIITGVTGMVGEGVLHLALRHPQVKEVLALTRKSTGLVHPKLKELVHPDFHNLLSVADQLTGYDACLFCLGVSSVGMKPEAYFHATYDLTLQVAGILSERNPSMRFSYVSGAHTDSSEKGRSRWARVKGKTENDLMKLPFRNVFAFRPGFIKPIAGLSHAHKYYSYISWIYPFGRKFFRSGFCTLEELALAMINVSIDGFPKAILEGDDIISCANSGSVRPGSLSL